MNDIRIKNKEIFIPKHDLSKLNIDKNMEVSLSFKKEGAIIRFEEKKESLANLAGMIKLKEKTNSVKLKRMAEKGEEL